MYKVILLFFLYLTGSSFIYCNEIDSLFLVLDKTMDERNNYDATKETKLLHLKILLYDNQNTGEQNYQITKQLIYEYEAYNFDSSLYYITKNQHIAKNLNNPTYRIESSLLMSGLLASSGRYKESIDILTGFSSDIIPVELKDEYFSQLAMLYGNLTAYSTLNNNIQQYNYQAKVFTDSLSKYLDKNDEKFLAIQEYKNRNNGNLLESKKINSRRLAMSQMGTRSYSIAAFDRSIIYQMEKDNEQRKKFLILSAISDIKSSTKDNASLSVLATILHDENKVKRAYEFINFSLEDATFYNSQLRFVSLSSILPLIHEAYEIDSNKQKKNLRKLLKVISILLFILAIAFIYIFWQMKKLTGARNDLKLVNSQLKQLNKELHNSNAQLNALNSELSESNHVKELYIANFLKICSNYIDKLENYRKMVYKQISNRKVQELHEITKSNRLLDSELKEFYDNFDSTFLSIYPNFVTELNNLIKDDERIVLKKDERLNTELRIFALIRLGISDSSKIAKLLRYSVNTIYNYRVRIKNKAAGDRDNFEKMIMKIDSISNNLPISQNP